MPFEASFEGEQGKTRHLGTPFSGMAFRWPPIGTVTLPGGGSAKSKNPRVTTRGRPSDEENEADSKEPASDLGCCGPPNF
jgi:hypothetical protein